MRKEIIIVDNILPNPDEVRAWALQQTFHTSPNHKGHRTQCKQCYQSVNNEQWADIIGCSTLKPVGAFGQFTFMTAEDPVVYHIDPFDWACVIYLTPDAPLSSGTSIWRPRNAASPFQGGFYDRTKFDLIDQVGNVYNRAIIWRGKNIHSATEYFGKDKDTGRLTQNFFWNE